MAVGSSALRGLVVALLLLAVYSHLHAQQTCMTSLYDAVAATPELAQLKTVIDDAGLQETFSNKSLKLTFLAPNKRFENLMSVLNCPVEGIISPNNKAASILKYHGIPSPVFAKDLQNGATVSTPLGKGYNLTVNTTSGVPFATRVNMALVVMSVVHITSVLLPAAFPEIPNYVPPPQPASCFTAWDRFKRTCRESPEGIPDNVPLPAPAPQSDCEMYYWDFIHACSQKSLPPGPSPRVWETSSGAL
ncbi:hypothetical protein R1flu_009154 [Riccia fluitans]|uniref:FAS1 domain-containing protein n=1 Tax=Riccia fluitans TaxID=41844 RepID=A0ABD1Z5F1_9MARC